MLATTYLSTSRRGWMPAALALVMLAVLAACGQDPTPTPTPTQTPTTTPTPTPVPDPILSLSEDSLGRDLIALLSPVEATCLEGQLGAEAFELLLQSPLFSEDAPPEHGFPIECIATETVLSLVIAGLSHAAGGLDDETVTCVRSIFENLDLRALVVMHEQLDSSQATETLGSVVGLLLCLTDEEASRVNIGGLLDGEDGPSLQDLRCVLQRMDVSALMTAMESLVDPSADPPAPQLLQAFVECGAYLVGGDFGAIIDGILAPTVEAPDVDPSQLDAEALALLECVKEALDEEAFNEIVSGQRLPGFEDLIKLSGCNIDLSRIAELGRLLGQ